VSRIVGLPRAAALQLDLAKPAEMSGNIVRTQFAGSVRELACANRKGCWNVLTKKVAEDDFNGRALDSGMV
jgi:hypothetical protein